MIAERTARRGGFTLIELMVVIALIAVLAALAAGTFFRIQAAEYERATAATLVKMDSHLKTRWTAVVEDAKKTVPAEVLALAGGDKDRATAIWTYAKLQSEFPESFAEVGTLAAPRYIDLGQPAVPTPARLTPKRVFLELTSKTYTPAPTPDEQAAALFYTAINSTSVGGHSPQSDGLNNQTMTLSNGLVVYKDAWGTPITFRRWAQMPEMQGAPYLHANTIRVSQSGGGGQFAVNNPLDPLGKLLTRTPGTENPWGDPLNPYRKACLALAPSPGNNPAGINLADFPNANFLPTLISYGSNKKPGMLFGGDDDGNDNIFSFRLRNQGQRGD